MCFVQLVGDHSEVEMKRKVDEDGMATEEYTFNSEVAIENQVSAMFLYSAGKTLEMLSHFQNNGC